jgi:23S rRNA (guanosine2251-2'-O)-methyltransferase
LRKLKLDELDRLDVSAFKTLEKIPVVVVLDSIRSAMNVGSFFRTADAFAFESIHLCGFTAIPPHKEITKTAIGATESVEWKHYDHISKSIEELKLKGYQIVIVEQTDASIPLELFPINKSSKYAIVFGNEVDGVDDEVLPLADHAVEISQYGTKHSLNVAVCGGVVMHHFSLKLKK